MTHTKEPSEFPGRFRALRWLTSPNLALASERPVDLLVTEPGCRAVLYVIHSIEHGLPA
ncbi:MbcA/ParS/Xre antitoxin family protein [Pseudomonas stutzeri]|uniref:antitoxin Xre/MbcA/ParS toxin-binding domain-containing protein n=1 Tax=Stutzerimonas stutzeri TaxID=316 RepID=UPI00190CEC4D